MEGVGELEVHTVPWCRAAERHRCLHSACAWGHLLTRGTDCIPPSVGQRVMGTLEGPPASGDLNLDELLGVM